MARQVAAIPARLMPRYADSAAREKRLWGKESDFITPPREGFPSILGGLWISFSVCMCERVGRLVECVFLLEDGLPPCCGACG